MPTHTVAVLGAGHAGHAIAADLSLAGHEVRLYAHPDFCRRLVPIKERGGITLTGIGRNGLAKVTVTTDIRTAVVGADSIFVATQAAGHASLADLCAPLLVDGQALVVFTGYGGALLFLSAMRRFGRKPRVLLGETSTLHYICRITGPATVEIQGKPAKANLLAAVPARDTEELVARIRCFYPIMRPAASVLETMLLNANATRHTVGTVLNIGRIEYANGEFWLYREGFSPSVWRVFERLDAEKMALMAALGLAPMSYGDYRRLVTDLSLDDQAGLDLKGPSSAETRYLTEDVPMGLVPWAELGDRLRVPTPICKAIIAIVSAIQGRDYASEGRTLARLGLGRVPVHDLRRAVDEALIDQEAPSQGDLASR